MRLLFILLFVIANCGSGQKQPNQEVEQAQLILIKATGLTSPVTLLETVTNTSFQILENGSHSVALSGSQGIQPGAHTGVIQKTLFSTNR